MNYKDFTVGDWIGHISGAIEDERELDGNEMRDLVEFLSKLSRWIPCSERLPKERGFYIVTEKVFTPNDEKHIGEFNETVEEVEFCNGKWKRAKFFEVVAWMPKPKPYKAESGE